jgi:hypothetical protein
MRRNSDMFCFENGFPTGTLGNDGVREAVGNDGVGDLWVDGKFILGWQTHGSAPTETDAETDFEIVLRICFMVDFIGSIILSPYLLDSAGGGGGSRGFRKGRIV